MEEKFQVHAQPVKAKKLNKLLSLLEADPVLKDNSDIVKSGSRQHEIRIRLLSLLLNLSNADTSEKDSDIKELEALEAQKDIENDIRAKQQEELQQWIDILNDGETSHHPSAQYNDDSLSDWTSSDDEASNNLLDNKTDMNPNDANEFKHSDNVDECPDVILPGCKKPLKPPEKVLPPGHSIHPDPKEAMKWMTNNVLSHYWILEKDGKTNSNYPLPLESRVPIMNVESNLIERSTANLVNDLDLYYAKILGIQPAEKTCVTEYQVMREIIWTFRYPQLPNKYKEQNGHGSRKHTKYPLFTYDNNKQVFQNNDGWLCMPSISPESLQAMLDEFGKAMTSLHRLAVFVGNILDRPILNTSHSTSEQKPPPLTYEAYAAGLSNLLKLFSADLIDLEKIVRDKKVTFTLLDLKMRLLPWFRILNCLASFHSRAVDSVMNSQGDDKIEKSNWEAAIILLSSLNEAIGSEFKDDMYAIYVDLFLKTIAPYFRIMGLWVSQGRLEDWRDEFIFAVNPEFHTSQMRLQSQNAQYGASDDEELDVDSASEIQCYGLQETFWTRGFLSRPYLTALETHSLPVPEIFEWTLPRILTCGKSIEILTILQKQGKLEKSSAIQFKYHVSFTQLYDEFIENVKKSLEDHKIEQEGKRAHNDESVKENLHLLPEVKDVIEDTSNYDPYLIAAFDTLFLKAGSDNESSAKYQDKRDILKIQDAGKDFLILSNYGLDPMKPLTPKFEHCLTPVIVKHVDKASLALLNLFRNTLNLEEHFSFTRKVFLMESGDLLSEFYTSIFEASSQMSMKKLADKSNTCFDSSIDSLSLTLMLHDCLYRRPPKLEEMVENFTVKVYGTVDMINDLENNIHLTYHVDWPLNIVLHSTSLVMYNQVFQFLLKIKHALWALQQIDANQLAVALKKAQKLRRIALEEYENFVDSDEESPTKSDFKRYGKNCFSKCDQKVEIHEEDELYEERKIHRILILRSWLLHFVTNVHSYIMTRVLHATQLELQGTLNEEGESKINNLDDIIRSHDKYIEKIHTRCFLNQSSTKLKQALLKVLNTCLELHKNCKQFTSDYQNLQLEPSENENDSEDSAIEEQSLKSIKYHLFKCTKGSGADLVLTERLLKTFEDNYFRSHHFLASTLRHLSQKRNIPHLDGLTAALVLTVPNRTHS